MFLNHSWILHKQKHKTKTNIKKKNLSPFSNPYLKQVHDLESQLKEKVDNYNQLLQLKEELERKLSNQEMQTNELHQVTKEMEKELKAKTRTEDELRAVSLWSK